MVNVQTKNTINKIKLNFKKRQIKCQYCMINFTNIDYDLI